MTTITLETLADRIQILTDAILANKQTLNLKEASAFTGLAESYLYKLTSAQEIPHYTPRGKKIYFDRTELELWLKTGRVKTNKAIESDAVKTVLRGA